MLITGQAIMDGGAEMAIGPVQRIALGFNHPDFHGEVIADLEWPRENDMVGAIRLPGRRRWA
jgi:hypothetical protein